MTGTIRTLRVDKGFGFIKDNAGKEYFFHQSAVYGEGLENLREGDTVEFDVGQGPKGLGPRTCGARPRKQGLTALSGLNHFQDVHDAEGPLPASSLRRNPFGSGSPKARLVSANVAATTSYTGRAWSGSTPASHSRCRAASNTSSSRSRSGSPVNAPI